MENAIPPVSVCLLSRNREADSRGNATKSVGGEEVPTLSLLSKLVEEERTVNGGQLEDKGFLRGLDTLGFTFPNKVQQKEGVWVRSDGPPPPDGTQMVKIFLPVLCNNFFLHD